MERYKPLVETVFTQDASSGNTTFAETLPISLNTPVNVNITATNQKRYYTFTAPPDGLYTFISSYNTGDPYGWLYNSSQNLLTENDDYPGLGRNFRIDYELTIGQQVYIAGGCYSTGTGNYSLTVTNNSALTVSTATWNPSSVSDSISIPVTSNISWTALSNSPSWLTVVSPSSGSNNGNITLNATDNTDTSPRTGTITITGGGITQTISVTQEAATQIIPITCTVCVGICGEKCGNPNCDKTFYCGFCVVCNPFTTTIPMIVAGNSHLMALKAMVLFGLGDGGDSGLLGDGTWTNKSTPVQVSNLDSITAIAAGVNHSLALKADGTVWAWGSNNRGSTW